MRAEPRPPAQRRWALAALAVLATLMGACCGMPPNPSRPMAMELPGTWSTDDVAQFRIRGRWKAPDSLTVTLEPAGSPIPHSELQDALRDAVGQWNATGAVTLRVVQSHRKPDITISWQVRDHKDCVPFKNFDGGHAHAGPAGEPTFIHLNRSTPWLDREDWPLVLRFLLLHELGHVLGIDHGPDRRSVMHASFKPRPKLMLSDVAAIQSLYGGAHEGHETDLHVVGFDTEGRLSTRTALRRVAPEGIVGFGVVDADGDARDDIVTWPLVPGLGDGPTIYGFGYDLSLEATSPVLRGYLWVKHPTVLGLEASGVPVLVSYRPDGRYLATAFAPGALGVDPWPEGRPLQVQNGPHDSDGDGILDAPFKLPEAPNQGELRVCGSADVNGDGSPDTLVKQGRKTWWRLSGKRSTTRSTAFSCYDAKLGDLDGDGTVEAILQGYRPESVNPEPINKEQ